MKVCVIQPLYSTDYARSDEFFERELAMMDACDASLDLTVMPESCDVPCLAKTKAESEASVEKYNARLLAKARETAARCGAILFLNARMKTGNGYRNTTYAFDRAGNLAGTYFKQHLVESEVKVMELDDGYTKEYSPVTVVEIDGIRFGFLICYDFYFYEAFARMARAKLDVIIGCSHQRSDTHRALEIMSQFLAYNTNAYVVRASVSMGEDSPVGGGSMIVTPEGEVLVDMKSRVGMETAEIDPAKKYLKPAGYGNPPSAHYEYIEKGRRPWQYRNAGSSVVLDDAHMPYPRVCAHRGFNTIAPENSLPAFGAAIAMGADEIEFDLWETKDGEIVSLHDPTLDRVSTGTGKVYDHTYAELLQYDFGVKRGEKFAGMKILTFEEILKKFAARVVMNIHIKTKDDKCALPESYLRKIVKLLYDYDCANYAYFMTGNDTVLGQLREIAPEITRCAGAGGGRWSLVERALEYGCGKIQLFKPYFNQAMIDKARENGIIVNVFWSDDAGETRKFLDMGIDCILTNDYNLIAQAVRGE